MEYSLRIFVRTRKKATINKIMFIGWVVVGLICFILGYYLTDIHSDIRLFISIIVVLFIIFYLIMVIISHFRDEELLGYFDDKIIFKESSIKIKSREIFINDIKKLEIYNGDYKGKYIIKSKYNTDGCLSQGIRNGIIISTQNGEKITTHFLMTDENQHREMEPLLIHYCQKGIIHRLHFMDILGLGYDEIQVYKKKYGI